MKNRFVPAVVSLLAFALAFALGAFLLMEFGTLVPAAVSSIYPDAETVESVTAIFAPLQTAPMSIHYLLPAVAAALFAVLRAWFPPKNGGVTFLYVLLAIVLWFSIFAAAFLLSRVNGIRMLDVMRVLIDMIRGGVLAVL